MMTVAKEDFLDTFYDVVLNPRSMKYRVQFPGPTGTNAVEAAIKLARKYTGRTNVIAFTNGFHGCTLGALSLTANQHKRGSVSKVTSGVTRWMYDGYFGA
jgi:diaminobutyrate-2-oxoglutarate transaminase